MNEEQAVFPGNGPLAVPSETGSPGSQTPAESASRREFLEFWAGYGRFYRLYSCREDKAARRELESLFPARRKSAQRGRYPALSFAAG